MRWTVIHPQTARNNRPQNLDRPFRQDQPDGLLRPVIDARGVLRELRDTHAFSEFRTQHLVAWGSVATVRDFIRLIYHEPNNVLHS